jgi:hypothetical protein
MRQAKQPYAPRAALVRRAIPAVRHGGLQIVRQGTIATYSLLAAVLLATLFLLVK